MDHLTIHLIMTILAAGFVGICGAAAVLVLPWSEVEVELEAEVEDSEPVLATLAG